MCLNLTKLNMTHLLKKSNTKESEATVASSSTFTEEGDSAADETFEGLPSLTSFD